MSKAGRKSFTKDFKLEAINLAEEIGIREAADSLGGHENTLYAWRAKFAADGTHAFSGKEKLKPEDEEIRRLKRELARVKEERDILKKATAFFDRNEK